MTNKPQSDMPDVIYAEKTMSIGNKACGKWATKEAISDYLFSENIPKYISEQSHLAALAELEAKHREEMLGLLDEIADAYHNDAHDLDYVIDGLKQRIGDSHE